MRAKEMDSYRVCVADSSDVLSRCSILHCQHSLIDQLPSSLGREGRHEGERRHVEDNVSTCTCVVAERHRTTLFLRSFLRCGIKNVLKPQMRFDILPSTAL